MAKKQYTLIVDVETTITNKVVDFGAVVCDRHGNVVQQTAVMVRGVFGVDELFYNEDSAPIWQRASVQRRMDRYNAMLDSGTRGLVSAQGINRWLEKVGAKYDPELTAYNLSFDTGKCQNTDIDLNIFGRRYCLWAAAVGNICQTKKYRQFVAENHLFNKVTKNGNMTYRTDAEAVTGFLTGSMTEEPHTSLEDIIGYELPTAAHIMRRREWRDNIKPYSWHDFQVRNNFVAK